MSKYDPLQTYLARQAQREAAMAFGEIERVLGFPLPPSARRHQAWWANNVGTHVNARAWRDAGWKTSRVDLASERVVFVRDDAGEDARQSRVIVIPVSFLNDAATRMIDEAGGDPARRAADLLNEAARWNRRALVDRFTKLSSKLSGDSADMIRADRDAR